MRYIIIFSLLLSTSSIPLRAEEFFYDPSHVTSQSQLDSLLENSLGVADGDQIRVVSPIALDMIKDFEQWRSRAYNDASMYCTIGYGHLLAKKSCEKCSVELSKFDQPLAYSFGLELLEKDTRVARVAISNLVAESLSDEQFGALTSFVFNIGVANFSKSRLLKHINNGELDQAGLQFGRWIKSKGIILDGLITRRACETLLFANKLPYGKSGKFSRDECRSLGAAPDTEDLIDIQDGEPR